MKKTITIKSSRDFTRTYHKGKSQADRNLVVYIFPNRSEVNKIGISIGKKVGNAVTRNRVKRLIRESYRLIEDKVKTGFDIVFIPRHSSKDAEFKDIQAGLTKIFKKLNILSEEVIM